MDTLPTTSTAKRGGRSKVAQTSKPSLFLAFCSCVAWLYVAGRLWQDAENRNLLAGLLKKNSAERPKVLTVEDKLMVLGCRSFSNARYAELGRCYGWNHTMFPSTLSAASTSSSNNSISVDFVSLSTDNRCS